jgi:hypothetical protein
MPDRKALTWKAVSFAAGAVAALVTRRALAMLWSQVVAALHRNMSRTVELRGFRLSAGRSRLVAASAS